MNHDPGNGSTRPGSFHAGEGFPAKQMGHACPDLERLKWIRQMFPSRHRGGGGIDRQILPLASAALPIRRKNSIRVEQIRNGQVELGEVVTPVRLQNPALGKKTRQAGSVNRANRIHPSWAGHQFAETCAGHHFEVSLRPLLPKAGYRRQGEQKVPEGPATDDENFQTPEDLVNKNPQREQHQAKESFQEKQ